MTKDKWVWMPHAAHFIMGHQCRFKLATYVGGVIVSTVGELVPDSSVRKIKAEVWGFNTDARGDDWDREYFEKFGFEELGLGRTYETMVFKAKKSTVKDHDYQCCPWEIDVSEEMDMRGYTCATDAYKGHMNMCKKWSGK